MTTERKQQSIWMSACSFSYFRFFKSSNRRARSSKLESSEPPPLAGGGARGDERSLALGTWGNGSWKGVFVSLSTLKPIRGVFADGTRGGGIDGPKLMFGYWG